MAGLIFHELLHTAGLFHFLGDGTKDPGDQVYACQRECFRESDPPAGNASACIGTACPAGTTLCKGQCEWTSCDAGKTFNPENCTCEAKKTDCSKATYCPCNDPDNGKPRSYSSEYECAAKCTEGLKCFNVLSCKPPPDCPH